MKRLISLILTLILCLSLAACTASQNDKDEGNDPPNNGESNENNNEEDAEQYPTDIVDITHSFADGTKYFKTHGRTSVSSEGLVCDTSASGIEFNAYIEGDLKIKLSVPSRCFFTLYIDGQRVAERIDSFDMNRNKELVLASFDDKKVHNIKLLKQSEAARTLCVLTEMSFVGYFQKPPADKELLIEIIGDSITAGYGNLCPKGTSGAGGSIYQDATQTYGFIASEKLGADASIVCYSGIGVATGWHTVVMEDFFKVDSYFRDQKTAFVPKRTPDVIVINLGTNDRGKGVDPDLLKAKVKSFVESVRKIYGKKVPIVWVQGMMEQPSLTLLRDAYNSLYTEDRDLVYFFVAPQNNKGGEGHPDLDAHSQVGNLLANYIRNTVLAK